MPFSTWTAVAAAVLFLTTAAVVSSAGPRWRRRWVVPASASLAFFAFSAVAVALEGPTGFWPEHTRHLWGNQIWFDLLLGVSVAWYLAAERLRAVGMRPAPWLMFVAATGSIGLLAMLARVLYLGDQPQPASEA